MRVLSTRSDEASAEIRTMKSVSLLNLKGTKFFS
jgi:hypothetical protein